MSTCTLLLFLDILFKLSQPGSGIYFVIAFQLRKTEKFCDRNGASNNHAYLNLNDNTDNILN
jgi:hypothetical protein